MQDECSSSFKKSTTLQGWRKSSSTSLIFFSRQSSEKWQYMLGSSSEWNPFSSIASKRALVRHTSRSMLPLSVRKENIKKTVLPIGVFSPKSFPMTGNSLIDFGKIYTLEESVCARSRQSMASLHMKRTSSWIRASIWYAQSIVSIPL